MRRSLVGLAVRRAGREEPGPVAVVGEVPGQLGRAGVERLQVRHGGVADALVVEKEESLVVAVVNMRQAYGAAHAGSKVVVAHPALGQAVQVREEVVRVQDIVPDVIKSATVQSVRA